MFHPSSSATVVASTPVGSARKEVALMASERRPTTETLDTVSDDVVILECPGGFEIRDEFEVRGMATTYYRNGRPVRIRYRYEATDRFYNSRDPSKSYTSTHANTIHWRDLRTGRENAMGVEYLL